MNVMRVGRVLFRVGDNKPFRVAMLGHWSVIQDASGIEDRVKWIGDERYVSAVKGDVYIPTDLVVCDLAEVGE